MTEVYVPSKGRANAEGAYNSAPTIRELLRDGIKPIVVVPYDERGAYMEAFPEASVIGIKENGIGNVRQWILQDARQRLGFGTRFWMLDDDLDDPRYRISVGSKYEFIPWNEWLGGVEDLTPAKDIALAGGFVRQFGWMEDSAIPDRRVGFAVLVNSAAPLNYWPLLHEDTDACIQVLEHDWRTVKLPQFVYHTTTLGWRGGGCGEDYERGAGRDAAFALQKKWNTKYPNLVRLRQNKEGHWTTRVNWKLFRHYDEGLIAERHEDEPSTEETSRGQ